VGTALLPACPKFFSYCASRQLLLGPNGPRFIPRIPHQRHVMRAILSGAIALGVVGNINAYSKAPSTPATSHTLRETSIYVFLVMTVSAAVQAVQLAIGELNCAQLILCSRTWSIMLTSLHRFVTAQQPVPQHMGTRSAHAFATSSRGIRRRDRTQRRAGIKRSAVVSAVHTARASCCTAVRGAWPRFESIGDEGDDRDARRAEGKNCQLRVR
jgi:hypothetical protein